MVNLIETGVQHGADLVAWKARRHARGIATGRLAPKSWATEAGAAPWLVEYGLVECETPGYAARTEANVRACDAVLWFGDPTTPDGMLTREKCPSAGDA